MTTARAPDFSVIITCFNKRDSIAAAIASARGQGSVTEVIVVDDGSTDGSRAILAQAGADRLILHETNKGALGAYLTGMRAARGRYLVLLDGDDRLVPAILPALAQAGWLDDGTCVRLGMQARAPHIPADPVALPLRRALTFRPGGLFTLSQSTGGPAFIFPRSLFVRVDLALADGWPNITVQDHVLPGIIGLVADRFIKLASTGYLMSPVDGASRLSHRTARCHHDRLLSDQAIAGAAEGSLRQSCLARVILRFFLVRRMRKLALTYGLVLPHLPWLLFSADARAGAVQVVAQGILASGKD